MARNRGNRTPGVSLEIGLNWGGRGRQPIPPVLILIEWCPVGRKMTVTRGLVMSLFHGTLMTIRHADAVQSSWAYSEACACSSLCLVFRE